MSRIHSYGGVLVPLEALRPLFRSRSLALAFASKLALTARLEPITRNGRLVVIGDSWKPVEDLGGLASRLGRTSSGDDLFELLCDCCIVGLGYRDRRFDLIRNVWNNYFIWFNAAADAHVPKISDFKKFGQRSSGRTVSLDIHDSSLHAVYATEEIFGFRLTAGGMGLRALLGHRPKITNWSEESY
jgi:hypothetical protein